MTFDIPLFMTALGLALIFEGLPYFLLAERMPSLLRMLAERHPGQLRLLGFFVLLFGLGLIYLARRF